MQELIRSVGSLKPTRASLVAYLEGLLASQDPILEVGGMFALLEINAVSKAHWSRLVDLSRHRAIQHKAFDHFLKRFRYDLAEKVASEKAAAPEPSEKFRALLANDHRAAADYEGRAFLADGVIDHLLLAAGHAEASGGWREGVLWLKRAFLINPMAPQPAGQLLNTFDEANLPDELSAVLEALHAANLHAGYRLIFDIILALQRKDHARLPALMSRVNVDKLEERLRGKALNTLALSADALGQYRQAYDLYVKQNVQPRRDRPAAQPSAFFERRDRLDGAEPGSLPPDARRNHVMMLGFPRSGTTLLENALAAHPDVETFEEIPSHESLFRHVEEIMRQPPADAAKRASAFAAAREAYYREIDRRARNAQARAFVDKLPIATAYIRFFEKMMPEKRYIFSIRHPYDVVLSCFRQSFKPNAAMDNFLRFDTACEAYDRVMSGWFAVFPGETPRVRYVKYDDLVSAFEREMRAVLSFIGADWNDAVLRFAEKADSRMVKTPSYAKVRQGLSIGVQSSWRNYDFLFRSREAEPLHKWAERFGYERA